MYKLIIILSTVSILPGLLIYLDKFFIKKCYNNDNNNNNNNNDNLN